MVDNNNNPEVHHVLESIQPCLLDLIDSTNSEIIYANQYSGLSPVELPEELVSLFKSDFGLVGTNILIQLENKMNGVAGGPWYIDSRNDCIYIHNRNFQDLPIYTYEYMANSGELLDVSFKTNYVKKQTSGGLSNKVNSDKQMSHEILFSPGLSLTNPLLAPYHYDSNYTGVQSVELPREALPYISDVVTELESRTRYGTNEVTESEILDMYNRNPSGAQASFNTDINQARIENYLNSLPLYVLQEEGQVIFQQVATNLGITVQELRNRLQEAMDKGNLEEYLKNLLGSSTHTFNNSPGLTSMNPYPTTVKIHELDLFQLDLTLGSLTPQEMRDSKLNNLNSKDTFATASGSYSDIYTQGYATEAQAVWELKNRGVARSRILQKSLTSLSEVIQILEVGELKVTRVGTSSMGLEKSAEVQYSQKVKVLVRSNQNAFSVPTYRIISDLYTRQLSEDATLEDVEAHVHGLIHANDAIMEKVITCRLTCVGNPFLTSSQVLTIGNVGKAWSGKWYIKKCRHNLNQSGYTCVLDLVLNSTLPGSSVVSTNISSNQPWDGDIFNDLNIGITSAEATYYANLTDTDDSDGTSYQNQVDFLLLLIQNKLSGPHQEEFNSGGIVRVTHNTSSTTGGVGVGATYTLDTRVTQVSTEVRNQYEEAAKRAVMDNSIVGLMMEEAVRDNDNK